MKNQIYFDEIFFLVRKVFHFLMQYFNKVISNIFGFDVFKSNFAENRSIVCYGQQMIATLSDIAQELIRVLLVSTTVI